MVKLAAAQAKVSASAVAAIQLAAPLIKVIAHEVPFGDAVMFLAGSLAKHVAAVHNNGDLLRKAEAQVEMVVQLVSKLEHADFEDGNPALAQVVEALATLENFARNWNTKSSWSKSVSFCSRNASSMALAFEKEFVACTALVDQACQALLMAVAVESFAGIQALRSDFADSVKSRQAEFASTSAALELQGQSLEQLHGSVAELGHESRAAGARIEALLEELTRNLQSSIATEVNNRSGGTAVGNAVRAAASAGALQAADELGADPRALELHLLNTVPKLLATVASESEATCAVVSSAQGEIEAAIERGRRSLQDQLDEVIARLGGGPERFRSDGLEPSLVTFLEKEGLTQLVGFFVRCRVLSLQSLAAVPEADMHELGLTPLLAARVAAVMDINHPSCPLRSHGGANLNSSNSQVVAPVQLLRLKAVLDPMRLSPLLKEVLENPGKEFGLQQSLDVVLELIEAGAEQALKLSGLSTVIVLGVTGSGKSTFINYLNGSQFRLEACPGGAAFITDDSAPAYIKDGAVSGTLLPGVHPTDNCGILTDCPGLFDTRAPAINVANGINVAACADAASAAKFVVLIEFSTAKAARGNALKDVFLALVESLGGLQSLRCHLESILLLVTKAPVDISVTSARELLNESVVILREEERDVALSLFGRAQLYHPLDQGHESWTKLDGLRSMGALQFVQKPGALYRSPLTFMDEKLLRDITNAQVAAVSSALREQRFSDCAEAMAALERLNVVGLRIVQILMADAASKIRTHVERFFSEAQYCLFNDRFDDALQIAQQVRALEVALRDQSKSAMSSTLGAELARSLSLRAANLEKLIEHRRLEEQRFAQTQREQKAQCEQTAWLQAELAKVELLNRGLASELKSVQNELVHAQEYAKTKARHLEATFLEKIVALEDRAARGERKEEATAEAAALRAEMAGALQTLHEEAEKREAHLLRSIEEQEALAKGKAAEEVTLRHDLENARMARRKLSLDEAQGKAAAAAVEAAERKAAEAAAQAQKAAALAHESSTPKSAAAMLEESAEGAESSVSVRAEGEACLSDLLARHNANLEALAMAADAQTAAREAQLAQALQGLEVSRRKAIDDLEPETAGKISGEMEEARAATAATNAAANQELTISRARSTVCHNIAVERTNMLYKSWAAKLEQVAMARVARSTSVSDFESKTIAAQLTFESAAQARAAALEATVVSKLAECKDAMSANEYDKAKRLKAEAEDFKLEVNAAAVGHDKAGIEEQNQMKETAQTLETAIDDATSMVKELESELAVLPKTIEAIEKLQPIIEKRKALRRDMIDLWVSGDSSGSIKLMASLIELPWSLCAVALRHANLEATAAQTQIEDAAVSSMPAAAKRVSKASVQACELCNLQLSPYKYSLAVSSIKHTCKSCGQVVCQACSPSTSPVLGYSTPQRVCDICVEAHTQKKAALRTFGTDAAECTFVASAAAQKAVNEDAASAPELVDGSAASFLTSAIEEAAAVGKDGLAVLLQKKINDVGDVLSLSLAIALDAFPINTIVCASVSVNDAATGSVGEVIGHHSNGRVEVRFIEGVKILEASSLSIADLPDSLTVNQACFSAVELPDEDVAVGQSGAVIGWSNPFQHDKIMVKFEGSVVNLLPSQLQTPEQIETEAAKTAAKMKLDVEACAKIGRPAGSTWLVACSVNGAAPGQECTVVGKAEEDGQLQVLLSAGTSTPVAVAKSDLVTLETWRKRQAVASEKLLNAARDGKLEQVKKYLAIGGEPDGKVDSNGSSALILASNKGHTDIVDLLLSAGAEQNAHDKTDSTALIRASIKGHIPVVNLLLKANASANDKDKDDWTALMYASNNGHVAVVILLLQAGADKNIENKLGKTALIYATEKKHSDAAALLR